MSKVIHEKEKCIGCGACAAVCPDFWEMADDGKAHLKGSKKSGDNFELSVDDVGCNEDAANTCPVQCIKIE
ncbi:MAG: ferredoxin [Candidatus Aenigmarchaeota archaeon]|nr:ferredoxin [Candidatus Aenigmarchaeota archaeon]